MKPTGAGAVMADRARGEVAGDDARAALCRKLEFFPTAPWAARAGGELVNAIDPPRPGEPWNAWDGCCGEGHMAAGLGDYFGNVLATDIHDWSREPGSCEAAGSLQHGAPLDFLAAPADHFSEIDWIITNPPFGLAAEIVATGLRRAKRGVAILARAAFFESASRFHLFFPKGSGPDAGGARLYAFAPFFERVPMTLGRWDPKASTATAYAWFVWMKPSAAADMSFQTRRLVGLRPEVWPIAPGTRDRLTRPDDARLWGARGAMALFEGQADG